MVRRSFVFMRERGRGAVKKRNTAGSGPGPSKINKNSPGEATAPGCLGVGFYGPLGGEWPLKLPARYLSGPGQWGATGPAGGGHMANTVPVSLFPP